jgi:hypothetical protein
VSLFCLGCGRTATAERMTANALADVLSWRRDDDGDWCLECQWGRGRTPAVARRLVRRAN